MKKIIVTSLAVLAVSSLAQAHVRVGGSDTGSPLHTATPTNFSDSAFIYRAAIIAGQDSALDVLNGGAADDRFVAARSAAETMLNTEFTSDTVAAAAVIGLAEAIRK